MTALDLARWAAEVFGTLDAATTHRIVTATTGPGPLPDYVSARVDPFVGAIGLPRPIGVVLARVSPDAAGSTAPVDEVVRRVLLTRNALLVYAVPPATEAGDGGLAVDAWRAAVAARVGHLATLAVAAGAPLGVLQAVDPPVDADVVLHPVSDAPVVVIVDDVLPDLAGTSATVVTTARARFTGSTARRVADLDQAVRVARDLLRDSGGDRVSVFAADPDVPLRVAAALPVNRVAVNTLDPPAATPDGLLTWTRISGTRMTARQPWHAPAGPAPAYPHASNEVQP